MKLINTYRVLLQPRSRAVQLQGVLPGFPQPQLFVFIRIHVAAFLVAAEKRTRLCEHKVKVIPIVAFPVVTSKRFSSKQRIVLYKVGQIASH